MATDSLVSPTAASFALRYGPQPHDSTAPLQDQWLTRDKALHVAFSGLGTLSAQYVLVQKVGWQKREALPVAAGTAVGAGVAKEIIDASRPAATASTRDLVADIVGVGLAVGVVLL